MNRLRPAIPLLVVVLVGAVVRTVPFIGSDFPLHDGGFFSVMAAELLANGFAIPVETAFNQAHIPFAYPPLGIAAAAAALAVFEREVVFQVLPWAYAAVSVGVMYWLARALRTEGKPIIAALAFALIPHAFDWLILGGGVTRAPGVIFAMAAIASSAELIRAPSRRRVVLAGAFGGLSVLSHPESGLFAAVSVLVLLAFAEHQGRAVPALAGAGLIGLIVAAPWWLTTVLQHGFGILLEAGGTRWGLADTLIRITSLQYSGAPHPLLDIFLLLGVMGAVHEIRHRRWFLPTWFMAVFVVMPYGGDVFFTIPLTLLSAAAVEGIGAQLVRVRPRMAAVVAALALGVGLYGALTVASNPMSPVDRIPLSDRQLMDDLRGSGLAAAGVLTGRIWWDEGPAEWFPALSEMHNPALAQGSEWLGRDAYRDARRLHSRLQACATESVDCLARWMRESGVDHVLVSAVVADGPLRAELASTDLLRLVAERGASVLVALPDQE